MLNLYQQNSNSVRFTEEQKKFILFPKDRDIKVDACAGSGKTECILQFVKQANLSGIDNDEICITTFNIQAINDIQKRADDLFGEQSASEIEIKNFDKLIIKSYESIKELENIQQKNIYEEELDVTLVEKQFYLFDKDNQSLSKDNKIKIFGTYKIIIFDEFQDINKLQYQILLLFKQFGRSSIIAVGDVYQNIYQFRGSDQKFLSTQDHEMINISMSISFRCSKEIIFFAYEIIKYFNDNINPMKSFQDQIYQDDNKQKQIPKLEGYQSYKEQFESIAQSINSYIKQGYTYKEISIISLIQQSLKEIEYLIEKQNYKISRKRDKNQDEMVIPYCSVIGDSSNFDFNHQIKQENKISLSTVHRAKGLEWKIVFFIGLSDDVIPMSFLRQSDFKKNGRNEAFVLCWMYKVGSNTQAILIFKESYIKDTNVLIKENEGSFYQKEFSLSQDQSISYFFDKLSNIQYIDEFKASQKYLKDIRINELLREYNKEEKLSEDQITQIFLEQQQSLLFSFFQMQIIYNFSPEQYCKRKLNIFFILFEYLSKLIEAQQFNFVKFINAFKNPFRKNELRTQIQQIELLIFQIKHKIQQLEEFNQLNNMLQSYLNKDITLDKNEEQLYKSVYAAYCNELCILDEIKKDTFYEYETFFTKDTIYEIIQSFEQQTAGKQTILTVLGKISKLKLSKNIEIKNILFYNPIQGTAVKYSLSNLNFHEEYISSMKNIKNKQIGQNTFNQFQLESFQNEQIIIQNIKEQNSKNINIMSNQIKQEEYSSKLNDSVQSKNILILDLEQSPTTLNNNYKKKKLIHAAPQYEFNVYKKLHVQNDESSDLIL
ncbi:hypothetical protein ABPG72_014967 [Tetrahymena utriculariae]